MTLVLEGCTRVKNNTSECYCDSISLKTKYLFYDYLGMHFVYDSESIEPFDYEKCYDERFLDSIITLIDKNEEFCSDTQYGGVLSLNRIIAYSHKHDYYKCLKYAEMLNDSVVGSTYKYIVVNRIKAMIAQDKGDTLAKNKIITHIVDTLESIVPKHEIDSIMSFRSADSLIRYSKFIYLCQYYYYLSQIKGYENVRKQLYSEYYDSTDIFMDDYLICQPDEKDFMIFDGL